MVAHILIEFYHINSFQQQVTFLIGNPMDFAPDVELLKSLKKSPVSLISMVHKHSAELQRTSPGTN